MLMPVRAVRMIARAYLVVLASVVVLVPPPVQGQAQDAAHAASSDPGVPTMLSAEQDRLRLLSLLGLKESDLRLRL